MAVSPNGQFYYNGTGGNNTNSWTNVSPINDLGTVRLIYGNGRYIAVGKYIYKSE